MSQPIPRPMPAWDQRMQEMGKLIQTALDDPAIHGYWEHFRQRLAHEWGVPVEPLPEYALAAEAVREVLGPAGQSSSRFPLHICGVKPTVS